MREINSNSFNISLFLSVYIIAQFLELFFNREFLVSVLPFGLAGISVTTVEPYLHFAYVVGGASYVILLILQPVLLAYSVIYLKGWGRALLTSVLASTVGLDLIHIAVGINNTSFNVPYIFSLIYVALIVASSFYLVEKSGRRSIYLLMVPDVIAFSFLSFAWMDQMVGNSIAGIISGYSGFILAYAVIFAGASFVIMESKKTSWKSVIPFFLVGALVSIATVLNIIPGWGFAIGVAFPYIFGILGVTDWMPPVIFFLAFLTLGVAIGLRKNDYPLFLGSVSLMAGTVIFDSIPLTVYMLAPLMASLIMMISKANMEKKAEVQLSK
ncbi:hypothetical protein IC006_0354 [Sulfuracidifex tepidarius]|uniref:Uncharacterized protein n=1 Tax=Sulfuracidifex tepidarius TaxID=1294262 RepID=A0A510DSG6_9CREN|nr:hypothetical protein [Sulfuracidifex tepidarius]BBG23070.1 hypothetical protein IC006_0354 [Sulfuracidifex tepidarius]